MLIDIKNRGSVQVTPSSCEIRSPNVVRTTSRLGSRGENTSWLDSGNRPFAAAGWAAVTDTATADAANATERGKRVQ